MQKKIFKIVMYFFLMFFILGCELSYITKGNICLNIGDYPMAIEFFRKEAIKNPGSYDARIGLGKALLQKAIDNKKDTLSWKKALIQIEAARNLNPDSLVVKLLSQVWAAYSNRLSTMGDSIAALEALASALQYDPQNITIINQTGILYFKLGYSGKAEILFNKSIKIDRNYAYSYFNLGMIFWANNKKNEARKMWLTALTLSPEDEDFIYWFARVEKDIREGK